MVAPFVDIHTHNQSRSNHIKVVSYFLGDNIDKVEGPICIGVHPWYSDISSSDLESRFAPYLGRIVAIGEIGLDRAIQIPIKKQVDLFVSQLNIAQKHQLPVVIHCVKAYSDILAIIPKYKELTYIFHGFYTNEHILSNLLSYNSYFSVGIRELERPRGAALIKSISINRLFLETDESSTNIEEVYNAASMATGIEITELREQLYCNYINLFK
jgi:TatD DNase family protein